MVKGKIEQLPLFLGHFRSGIIFSGSPSVDCATSEEEKGRGKRLVLWPPFGERESE